MANIIIGKVAPTFKGEWDSTVTYNRLDIVSYNGSSYGCVSDNVNNKIPTNETYWKLVASKGDISSVDCNLGNNTYNDF